MTSMQHLLDLLKQDDPIVVSDRWRQRFRQVQIPSLWQPHLTPELAPCPHCQHTHRIRYNRASKRFYFTCRNGMVSDIIAGQTFKRWTLHVPTLMQYICEQLQMQPNITRLKPPVIWRLGFIELPGTARIIECWLCRRVTTSVVACLLNLDEENNVVLLTLGSLRVLQQCNISLAYFDLYRIIEDPFRITLNRAFFYQWLAGKFQRVFFDTSNGDLLVDGKCIVSIKLASPPYYFLRCLWEQYNLPVSHEDIFMYCCRQLAKRDGVDEWFSEYVPASFCHTMKREIRGKAKNFELCHQIIEPTKTVDRENGYRLIVPKG